MWPCSGRGGLDLLALAWLCLNRSSTSGLQLLIMTVVAAHILYPVTPARTHGELIPRPLHALHHGSESSLEVAMPVTFENIQECCLAVSAGPFDQFLLMSLN